MVKSKSNSERLVSNISLIKENLESNLSTNAGIFGIESEAKEEARQVELSKILELIKNSNIEFKGVNTLVCPKCGKNKCRNKGERVRKIEVESGEVEIKRGYYLCKFCNYGYYPLDKKLGLKKETKEQGCLREKLSLIGVLVPYHQSEEVCRILLGRKESGMKVRRNLLRESDCYDETADTKTELETNVEDTLYMEIDGHMCPTRAEKRDKSDQGFREAKMMIAFRENDIANVSKQRNEILHKILVGEITSAGEFRDIAADVYERAKGEVAGRVVMIGDGAKWIWNIADEVSPEAIQILDYSHAKQYLWEASEMIFGKNSDLRQPWVQQQKSLLFLDKVEDVIDNIAQHQDRNPELIKSLTYLKNNKHRMLYGSFRSQGLLIGSGAIESAGKRIAHSRVKGSGMRWNIDDLNKVIKLRCAFYDSSWGKYWNTQKSQLVA